jgi:hypothetical protein
MARLERVFRCFKALFPQNPPYRFSIVLFKPVNAENLFSLGDRFHQKPFFLACICSIILATRLLRTYEMPRANPPKYVNPNPARRLSL